MRKTLLALAGALMLTGCYAPGAVPVYSAPPPVAAAPPGYQCLQPLPGEPLAPYVDPYTGQVMQGMHSRGACTQIAPPPYVYAPPAYVAPPQIGLGLNFHFGRRGGGHHHRHH